MIKKITYVTLLLIATVFCGCNKDQVAIDTDKIAEYLVDNNLAAEQTEDGLYYVITKEGTGERPDINSKVTVHYKGYKLNGDIFDSSYDRGQKSTFPLSGVIQGWQLGIPLFKEGGSGTLIIPSHLAYGNNPPNGSGIKKNEVLVFDIELFEVK
jgi:FKBP-type peptidyl-prolyl cis-trans isomerase FkpA